MFSIQLDDALLDFGWRRLDKFLCVCGRFENPWTEGNGDGIIDGKAPAATKTTKKNPRIIEESPRT